MSKNEPRKITAEEIADDPTSYTKVGGVEDAEGMIKQHTDDMSPERLLDEVDPHIDWDAYYEEVLGKCFYVLKKKNGELIYYMHDLEEIG